MKPATNRVDGLWYSSCGDAHLLDHAAVHHHHPIGQRHRLDLVVRHVDRGGAHRLMHLLDLGAHLHAQFGVQVGQRLIEQEDLRVADDGAAHGDALPLAAGQGAGLAVQQRLDVQDARRLVHPALDLVLRELPQLQAKRHVVEHAHVGVERVVLEHHGDVAVARRHVVDDVAADPDLPGGNLFQPGDHAQRGGLAAAGGADQHHEFAIGNFQVDAFHRLHATIVDLDYLAAGDFSHCRFLPCLVFWASALGCASGETGHAVVH